MFKALYHKYFKKQIKDQAPNLSSAHREIHVFVERLEDLLFYISQIKGRDYIEENERLFAHKAHFFLASYRDELKIALDRGKRNGRK